MFPVLLGGLQVPRLGPGRPAPAPTPSPRTRPTQPAHRAHPRSRRIRAVIPEPSDQIRQQQGRRGGRPVTDNPVAYRGRNVIERAFNQLKSWRGLASRYNKHGVVYRGALVLAPPCFGSRHRETRPRRSLNNLGVAAPGEGAPPG